MLKLTYLDNDFHLERFATSLEDWVTARLTFLLHVGEPISLEKTTASFLLPADLPEMRALETQVRRQVDDRITLDRVDCDYREVSLRGTWLTSNPEAEEGIFLVELGDRTEFFLFHLWMASKTQTAMKN
ncbi:hypothetical protein PN466_24435 [Roseofilum reptotaenium CS-1145]|uniref:Uncharacterized protein n=1 Tax=Roseofilum reptotaenium AO1-A TaxID=1925591 RepID=A0A1L9QQ34_9CYAN|nr:alr0857 family protein [Roseofilum reptotaenium]MDB9520099.1 hypothetical protein [Roseofilum reptotaenium CS-1145]OJJ24798.1 hypothetical protein BI308_14605 [Roseofilum reptotaenium AO1-A]